MPYKNIVFIKLEKRIFNDPRWYMMSEPAQLNFIRLVLFAAETYNKIPKNLKAIKLAFKTDQDVEIIEKTISEIKSNFPKFKENKSFYYFDGFDEKTNYIADREFLGKSRGLPKEATDIDIDKEEEKIKNKKSESWFSEVYEQYPNKDSRKKSLSYFISSVKTDKDFSEIKIALENYKQHLANNEWKRPQSAKTWFNNWKDWVNYQESVNNKSILDDYLKDKENE